MKKNSKERNSKEMALTPFHDKDKDQQQQQQQIAPWDPIAIDPFEMMGSVFDHSPIFPMFQNIVGGGSSTQVDWKETSDSHILKADLPGKLLRSLASS